MNELVQEEAIRQELCCVALGDELQRAPKGTQGAYIMYHVSRQTCLCMPGKRCV